MNANANAHEHDKEEMSKEDSYFHIAFAWLAALAASIGAWLGLS